MTGFNTGALTLRTKAISLMNKFMRIRFKDYMKTVNKFDFLESYLSREHLQPVCQMIDMVNFCGDPSKVDWSEHDKNSKILESIDDYPDDLTVGDLIALSAALVQSDIKISGRFLSPMAYKGIQLAKTLFIEPLVSIEHDIQIDDLIDSVNNKDDVPF